LAVDVRNGTQQALAGAVVFIEQGRPTACASDLRRRGRQLCSRLRRRLARRPSGGDESGIELDGDHDLATALINNLRRILLGRGDRVPVA